jgi:hypothetical protein
MYPDIPIGHNKELRLLRWDLAENILKISNYKHRRSLNNMYNTADKLFREMDMELVKCRRNSKYTLKYHELHKQCNEQFRTVSKYLLQAMLMKDYEAE